MQTTDFAKIQDLHYEDNLRRSIIVSETYSQNEDFDGLCKLKAVGWQDQSSLVFHVVTERAALALETCWREEQLRFKLPGTTFLLGARAMDNVLITLENLATEGYVVCGIDWQSFCMREGLMSGFLRNVSFFQRDIYGHIGNFPYYEESQFCLRIEGSFYAVLISFLQNAVPAEFSHALINFPVSLQKTPHNFVVELLKLPWPRREQLKADVDKFFVKNPEEEFLELGGHRSALHHLVRKYSSVSQQESYSKHLCTQYPDSEEL